MLKKKTRRERLKSALYLRLKQRKAFKIVEGGPLGFLKIQSVAKKSKNERRDPSVSSAFPNTRKSFKLKQRLEPVTPGFPVHRLKSVLKSGTYTMRSVVWQKKKKTSHCNSRALFSRKAPTKNEFQNKSGDWIGVEWSCGMEWNGMGRMQCNLVLCLESVDHLHDVVVVHRLHDLDLSSQSAQLLLGAADLGDELHGHYLTTTGKHTRQQLHINSCMHMNYSPTRIKETFGYEEHSDIRNIRI